MSSPLKDLVVLELASVLAGPGVGQFFAELGAEVIKIENHKSGGDVTRSWRSTHEKTDDRSAYFCAVNWGKQSIAVDLTSREGREIVHALALRSQVILTSFKPGDAEKLSVDYATLSAINPSVIYGQITGYGADDPRVGYDAIIQAEAGFMFMNGEPGGPSLKMPVALMDILAGHQLKEGLLVALLEQRLTGAGKFVAVSLIQAAVASLANQGSNFLVGGMLPGKQGSAHPNIAPYGDVFRAADGREILLAIGTDKQFDLLCKILKISDISHIFHLKTNVERVRNRPELNAILAQAISQYPSTELLEELHAAKIPAGVIRSLAEVFDDLRIQDILFSNGSLTGVRSYVAHNGSPIHSHLTPPPHLGEHTARILQEVLKFSPTAVSSLISAGIIQ